MQLTNAPEGNAFLSIETALNGDRLARYMPAASNDKALALQLYVWNCALCEAFYGPLHFAEILCRNAIHNALQARLGQGWYQHRTFRKQLSPKFLQELDNAVADEHQQHGGAMTDNHVVSALTFGFWEHMTTKRFERLLWIRGLRHSFPNMPWQKGRQDVHDLIESTRRWRNRIAHHRAIFDKGPTAKYQDTMMLIEWICADTAAWVTEMSSVSDIIKQRP